MLLPLLLNNLLSEPGIPVIGDGGVNNGGGLGTEEITGGGGQGAQRKATNDDEVAILITLQAFMICRE